MRLVDGTRWNKGPATDGTTGWLMRRFDANSSRPQNGAAGSTKRARAKSSTLGPVHAPTEDRKAATVPGANTPGPAQSKRGTLDYYLSSARQLGMRRAGMPLFLARAVTSRLLDVASGTTDEVAVLERSLRQSHLASADWTSLAAVAPPPVPPLTVPGPQAAPSQWGRPQQRVASAEYVANVQATCSVVDFAFDERDEFAIVLHKSSFRAYRASGWTERVLRSRSAGPPAAGTRTAIDDSDCLVTIKLRPVRQNLYSTFTSAQFMSSTLACIVTYKHNPCIDVFDLEQVDEVTSDPQHRFILNAVDGSSASGDLSAAAGELPYAEDVASITPHTALAALSNGLIVWVDERCSGVQRCAGATARTFALGSTSASWTSRPSHFTTLGILPIGTWSSTGGAPSTRAASGNPIASCGKQPSSCPSYVITGSKDGLVRLWDTRFSGGCLGTLAVGSEVGRVHPSADDPRGIWLNTFAGSVLYAMVSCSSGDTDFRDTTATNGTFNVVSAFHLPDATRSNETFGHQTPRLAVMEPAELVFCPHISTSSLMVLDGFQQRPSRWKTSINPVLTSTPLRQLTTTATTAVAPRVEGCSGANLGLGPLEAVLRADGHDDYDGGEEWMLRVRGEQLRSEQLTVNANGGFTRALDLIAKRSRPAPLSLNEVGAVDETVRALPVVNVLAFPDTAPRATCCAVLRSHGMVVVGDTEGGVFAL